MTDEQRPGGRGVKIARPDAQGAGAVSQADGISECRPPLRDRLPSDSRHLGPAAVVDGGPFDLESVLEWSRRAAEDRSEVPALLDELDRAELRALAARLVQLVGLLELCPPGVEAGYFIARVTALSGDFALDDPWATTEASR